jgi:Phage related hypothetical protein (DUF1799)
MGFREEAIKEELAQHAPEQFELWPEHIDAWRLFVSVQHQWRVRPFGGRPLGLDYPSVQVVLDLMFPGKRKRRLELFQQLQIIEAGALEAWPTK